MFKNVVKEFERKNNYFFKIPDNIDTIRPDLYFLFHTPNTESALSKESDERFKNIMKKYKPEVFSSIKVQKYWKEFLYTVIARDSYLFSQLLKDFNINNNKEPNHTEWEKVIVERGNYRFAEGFSYRSQIIGLKIAMAIREKANDWTTEFEMSRDQSLNPYWMKLSSNNDSRDNHKTKTDIILGKHKISLKKKGKSQIFSGEKGESYALITYALNQYIDKNENGIVKKIDDLTKKFESNSSKKNNFSAYLLTTFTWSDNVKKIAELNKKTFKKDIKNKATIILKTMAVDYFKILKKENPNLDEDKFKDLFIKNIQNLWYDNLDDMKILQQIASNTDSPSDDEIFNVEKMLGEIKRNYIGDSVKGTKEISKQSLELIKKKISADYDAKLSQYTDFIDAKKQFKISTKIMNDVFAENPEVKLNILYEGMSGRFKFNNGNGTANYLCVYDTENGGIKSYDEITMEFIKSIENRFDIMYTFKSKENIESNSKAAYRAYFEDSDLLNFQTINENFVQYLKKKYKSLSRTLVKILLSRIRKILKTKGNKIRLLSELFKTKLNRNSIKIKEDLI